MNICEEYAALLDLYVDGELSPEEMSHVQDHLDRYPGCRAYVDDALAIRAAFPDVEETEVPAGFAEGVMARIQTDAIPQKKPTPWRKVLPTLAACCALVILLRSVPGMFSGSKAEAPAMAAPAMTTESASDEKSEAVFEEPATIMDRQIAADSSDAVTEVAEAPAECAVPQEAEKAAGGPYAYTDLSGTVYTSILTLPPEGAELMAAYAPVSESGTEVQYELTPEEAQALLVQLETATFSYQSEDGIDPTTDMILVVLSK